MTAVEDVSRPSRLAEADEGISAEELQLAARNHAMPLEALRYDVTPTGLHYLLTHYDIPMVDPAGFRLTIDGLVEVDWIATLPAHRGRGYGAALTWAAATIRPELPAALIASDDGAPVYRRLGFLPVNRCTLWHRPPQT